MNSPDNNQEEEHQGDSQDNTQEHQGDLPKSTKQGEQQVQMGSNEEIDCLVRTGKWLVIMNRHVVLHPNERPQSESVDLLHRYTPLYLPYVQIAAERWDWWDGLNMQEFFPEDIAEFRCNKPMENNQASSTSSTS